MPKILVAHSPAAHQRLSTACGLQRKQSSSAAETADTAASTSGAGVETPSTPVTREFNALGSKVVESNIAFKGPEDEKDFWEGEQFDGEALQQQGGGVRHFHQQCHSWAACTAWEKQQLSCHT